MSEGRCTTASTSAGPGVPFYYCLLFIACCQRSGDCICLKCVCRTLNMDPYEACSKEIGSAKCAHKVLMGGNVGRDV